MLNVALIGLGDVSKIHVSTIRNNPDVSLVAVSDINEKMKTAVPEAKFYNDYTEMLDNERLDCVHICLPHHLHYEATKKCMDKGIHVYLEKPLAHTVDEGQAIVALEEKYPNTKICISLQNRLNDTFCALKDEVQSGQYGKILGVRGLVTWFRPESYYTSKLWRGKQELAGGGVLINQAIHTLDLMQVLGGDVKEIKGSVSNLHNYNLDVEDTAVANITFTNKAKGLLFATTTNAVDSSVELQVVCESAEFTIRNEVLYKTTPQEGEVQLAADVKLGDDKFYYGEGHSKLINHFYKCIVENRSDYIHAQDALMSLILIDSIIKSSAENKQINMQEMIINK